jgi:D-alanyl-D-alanine carboxypeptidase/D-alanyl-D-alanine-endopeptidase (penicillin-binding protein 4)
MKHRIILILSLLVVATANVPAQHLQAVQRFLHRPEMAGATFSLMIRDIATGDTVYAFEPDRELIPASVMKLVTTAAALELLGEEYRYTTTIEHDGEVRDSILHGNIYIRGSGDPTLGSAHFAPDRSSWTFEQNTFIPQWTTGIAQAGIRSITGRIIADESIFDTEGISMKWLGEDLGSYYGAGSYGLSVFDNSYTLYICSGASGGKPEILSTSPDMSPFIRFHNYLTTGSATTDSAFILGMPYSSERYLYGLVPANSKRHPLKGDIPDPPLFLATALHSSLTNAGVSITSPPATYRTLTEEKQWTSLPRRKITATHSPILRDIIRIINERSHNLFADALLKTIGLGYKPHPGEILSTSARGIRAIHDLWDRKGLHPSSLRMYDGSGLSPSDKITASFICNLLVYMSQSSRQSAPFLASIPQAGMEGSVRSFLRNTPLRGQAYLKSGSMSRVRTFAGYIDKGSRRYAIAILLNNYSSSMTEATREMEKLVTSLFPEQ